MLDFNRLLPRQFLARSLGAGILYFLIQVAFLSWYAYDQCSAADDSGTLDCIWYVYKQVPSPLPLAAVFAAGMMVLAEILHRFAESMPSTDESSKRRARDWFKAILLVGSVVIVVLGFTVFSDEIPLALTLLFEVILYLQVTQPWVSWITRMVGVDRNSAAGEMEDRE